MNWVMENRMATTTSLRRLYRCSRAGGRQRCARLPGRAAAQPGPSAARAGSLAVPGL